MALNILDISSEKEASEKFSAVKKKHKQNLTTKIPLNIIFIKALIKWQGTTILPKKENKSDCISAK